MKILLCSTSDALRRRWAVALEEHGELYHAPSLRELEILLNRMAFDILLLHRATADLALVARIRAGAPGCRLFVLSDRPDDGEGLEFLRHGAVGYGNAFITPARLRQAVRLLADGSVWVGQGLMERLIREAGSGSGTDTASALPAVLRSLSNREHQVARLVARGFSNREIADRLGITERTVKAHLGSIYTKTGTRDRLNLALLLRERIRETA